MVDLEILLLATGHLKRNGYVSHSWHMFLVLRGLRHAQTLFNAAYDGAAEAGIIAIFGTIFHAVDSAKDLLDLVKSPSSRA